MNSPAQRMVRDGVRLFFSVTARDVTLEANVSGIKDYGAADILYGMRYADAVSRDEAGRTLADIGRLSELEPDGQA